MPTLYGQATLIDPSTNKLHGDFVPADLTVNGLYPVISVQTSDMTASDVTLATLVAPAGKTVLIPVLCVITVVSKTSSVSVAPIINIGKTGALYDDMVSAVTIPTGLLDSTRSFLSGVSAVYEDGDVIKLKKTTAITGGPITVDIKIFGYWL
jgi:hypothetical protein